MKLSLCPQPLYDLDFDRALDEIRSLGLDTFELPVDARSPWIDLETLQVSELRSKLSRTGLHLSAISNHQESLLLLGPHHRDTDGIFEGSAEAKRDYAKHRLLQSARLASDLEVDTLIGFVGCEDQTRLFPWPDPQGWESMLPRFRDEVAPLLDSFESLGVRFAMEPHPKNMVYNTETALESVALFEGHRAWGFNFDPANLMLAGVDPLTFIAELGDRLFHVHLKDAEIVPHRVGRSGLLAHGAWDRKDRGFRFRIPGWGDIPWKRIMTELRLGDYEGALAIENEDPIFEPMDGLRKAIDEMRPLLPQGPRKERWW